MDKKLGPYVGVTGIMNRTEEEAALAVFPPGEILWNGRLLMTAVLVNLATINDQRQDLPGRYPKSKDVGRIFIDDPRVLNMVNYSTSNAQVLLEQLSDAVALAGPYWDGVQISVPWPDLDVVIAFRRRWSDKVIVLQANAEAMDACSHMNDFLGRLGAYAPWIDHVLIDPSGGNGKQFVPAIMAEYLQAIRGRFPELGTVVAGGLSPCNFRNLLGSLVADNPSLSTDMESRIRMSLDDSLSVDYMQKALRGIFSLWKK